MLDYNDRVLASLEESWLDPDHDYNFHCVRGKRYEDDGDFWDDDRKDEEE